MFLLAIRTLAVLELLLTCAHGADFQAQRDVDFLLRIRNRPFDQDEVFQYEKRSALSSSSFDPRKPTTFIVHGFTEDRKNEHHIILSK